MNRKHLNRKFSCSCVRRISIMTIRNNQFDDVINKCDEILYNKSVCLYDEVSTIWPARVFPGQGQVKNPCWSGAPKQVVGCLLPVLGNNGHARMVGLKR